MSKRYSRLRRTQKRKNTRSAFFFIVASMAMVAFFIFVGMPLLIKYTSFVSDIRKSSEPIERNDTTPPPPPMINSIPRATNSNELDVSGRTEPGVTVKIIHGSNSKELISNSDGKFSTTITLNDGENKIRFKATDKSGNESKQTETYSVIYDSDPPELIISSPEDGKSLYGSGQRQLTIDGSTDEGVRIYINERIVVVDDRGNFSYLTSLSEGENNFTIIAKDEAGNQAEQSLAVNYSP
jgi:hypothetical protein